MNDIEKQFTQELIALAVKKDFKEPRFAYQAMYMIDHRSDVNVLKFRNDTSEEHKRDISNVLMKYYPDAKIF